MVLSFDGRIYKYSHSSLKYFKLPLSLILLAITLNVLYALARLTMEMCTCFFFVTDGEHWKQEIIKFVIKLIPKSLDIKY